MCHYQHPLYDGTLPANCWSCLHHLESIKYPCFHNVRRISQDHKAEYPKGFKSKKSVRAAILHQYSKLNKVQQM